MSALVVANSKGLGLQRVRDTPHCNKKEGCCRHHKWQKGPEARKRKCRRKSTSAGVVFSKFPHSSAIIQAPRHTLLFCACDPKLTLSPTTSLSYHKAPLFKTPIQEARRERFLQFDSFLCWVVLHVTALYSHIYPKAFLKKDLFI